MASISPERSPGTPASDATEIRRETAVAVKNATVLGLSLVCTLGVAVAVRIWMPRYLGPDAFGILHFAEELTAACMFFTTLGVETYIKRDVATRANLASDFFGGLLAARLMATLLVCGGLALILTGMDKSVVEWRLVYIFALGQAFFVLNITLAACLQARGQVRELAMVNVASKMVWGSAVVLGLTLGGAMTFVAIAFCATEALKAPPLFWACRRHLGLELRWRWRPMLAVLGFSLPFYVNQLTHEIYGRAGATFLSGMAKDQEVGWYGAANHVKTLVLLALPIINAVVLPMGARLLQRSEAVLNEMMRGCLRLVLCIAAPLGWLLMLNAGDLVLLLYSQEYAPAARHLRVMAPLIPMACLCVLSAIHLLQLGRVWLVTKISLVGLVVNLVSTPMFIIWGARHLGVGGAGTGTAAAAVLTEACVAALLLAALGPAGVDRRLFALAGRLAMTAVVVALAHLLLRSLGIWRLPIEVALSCAVGVALGAIPLRQIITQARAIYAGRGGSS